VTMRPAQTFHVCLTYIFHPFLFLTGEREEELEALRSDFTDVKETFRMQVDELVGRLVSSETGAKSS
jgi:hypothetical protein